MHYLVIASWWLSCILLGIGWCLWAYWLKVRQNRCRVECIRDYRPGAVQSPRFLKDRKGRTGLMLAVALSIGGMLEGSYCQYIWYWQDRAARQCAVYASILKHPACLDRRGVTALEYGIMASVLGLVLLYIIGFPGDPNPRSFSLILEQLFSRVSTSI